MRNPGSKHFCSLYTVWLRCDDQYSSNDSDGTTSSTSLALTFLLPAITTYPRTHPAFEPAPSITLRNDVQQLQDQPILQSSTVHRVASQVQEIWSVQDPAPTGKYCPKTESCPSRTRCLECAEHGEEARYSWLTMQQNERAIKLNAKLVSDHTDKRQSTALQSTGDKKKDDMHNKHTWYCAAVLQFAILPGSAMRFFSPWAPNAPRATEVAP